MPLEDLLTALREEADAERAQREYHSRQQAADIVADAEHEAAELVRERLRLAKSELDAERVRRRAVAELAAARERALSREALYVELLDDLRAWLKTLRAHEGYPALFTSLLTEGTSALPAARRVQVDPRDERLAREVLAELGRNLEVRSEIATCGGLDLEADDGRRVRNTLEARLQAADPDLRMCFANALAVLTAREERSGVRSPQNRGDCVREGRL